jgi:hypothetical protein
MTRHHNRQWRMLATGRRAGCLRDGAGNLIRGGAGNLITRPRWQFDSRRRRQFDYAAAQVI